MAFPHPERWRIRFSSKNKVGFIVDSGDVEANAVWARRWDSREAAVAYALRFVEAKIVTSVDQLSILAPTCFIEQIDP